MGRAHVGRPFRCQLPGGSTDKPGRNGLATAGRVGLHQASSPSVERRTLSTLRNPLPISADRSRTVCRHPVRFLDCPARERILHVLYFIDSLVPAGAERSLVALAPHLAQRGVQLDVAYLHDRPGLQDDLERAGAQLFCLAGNWGRAGWLGRATRLISNRRPALVHTTLYEADLVGRVAGALTGRPIVSSLVNVAYGPEMLDDPNLRRWKVRTVQLADGATARLVRRFHAITEYVADVMAVRLRIPRDRIDVVPRGRDPRQLGSRTPQRRERARATLEVDEHALLLIAIARHERQKGLDILLESFPGVLSRFPTAQLVVLGRDGNQTPLLRSMLERLSLYDSVRLLGVRVDVVDLLCGADLFVFPSRWEGLGGAILEAMALEIPIVASDLPVIREVVGDDNAAWLAPVDRPDALADAVLAALADPDEAGRRGRTAGTRFRERYTIDAVADGMTAFYRRALSED